MGETAILALNAYDSASAPLLKPELLAAVERRRRAFGSSSVLAYQQPIRMASASGVFMRDEDGRDYLDLYNNVPSVGHAHPRVVEAIRRQAAILNTNTRYLNDVVDSYAERLLGTFPPALNKLVLTCTGSEANDLALRIARAATDGEGFVVTRAAYHGNTAAVTDVSPSSWPGQVSPRHVRTVAAPDAALHGDLAGSFAASVEAAIDDLVRHGVGFAGLLVDTIFSSDGVFADPAGFLAPAADAVRARGGVFIADEVQPGFGRTGDALWGFQRHTIAPDIVTMGKPMGNGFPMGGVVTRPDWLDRFTAGVKYFNTFGGNPVAAAAGMAVLDIIEDEGLMANARDVGTHLLRALRELSNRHSFISDVRGAGLFIGMTLARDRASPPDATIATAAVDGLRRRGILTGAAGLFGDVLKIRPPLCFSHAHAETFVEACDDVLTEIARTNARRA